MKQKKEFKTMNVYVINLDELDEIVGADDYKAHFYRISEELQNKEQECEHWKSQCLCLDGEDLTVQISQEQFEEYQNYKQTLDEIEEFCIVYSNNHDAYETVYKYILDIINKAKENKCI